MASCHAEIYHKNGSVDKVAYVNDGSRSLDGAKQMCMFLAQQQFDQEMRTFQDPFKPTHIQIVVD